MQGANLASAPAAPAGLDAATITEILSLVRARTGVDFSSYRPATVERRIANRMVSVGIPTCAQYLQLLRHAEREAIELLARLTIKVSRFYRHKPAFDRLRHGLLHELAAVRDGQPLRLWSAGCGTGEEPYTLAMLLEEAGLPGEVLATDIDRHALEFARAGVFPASAVPDLPAELGERYLKLTRGPDEPLCEVVEPVRRRVRFAFHDITSAATPPEPAFFELISCRNVLIYMQRALQEQTLNRARQYLATGGLLLLGEAEWPPPSVARSLSVLDARAHLFRASP